MGKWLLGIIILAIVSGLLAFYGPWSAKAASAEMGQSIQAALRAGGHNATVNMSGNVANLTGTMDSKQAAAAAISAAQNADCPRCKDRAADKRWHVVANGLTVNEAPAIPTQSPYTFNATKSATGGVVLNGYVRNEAERDRVLAEARRLFPGNVTDRTVRIALGEPNTAWPDMITTSLGNLAALEQGTLTMNNNDILLRGRAADVGVRDSLNDIYGNLSQGYSGATNISVPDAVAVNVGEVKDQGVCQELFNELKGDTKINFPSARAEIRGKDSFDLLNTLASAAKQCSSFRIQVDGHTDSTGDEVSNQSLSERRARTVVAYLAKEGGIAASRISATGYGEDRPIGSNDTEEGRAQNRRIEFTVTQAE